MYLPGYSWPYSCIKLLTVLCNPWATFYQILQYENMPIQTYWKFYHHKKENFRIKNSDIFHISAQNIDCGYPLEPPRRGGSNEYPQSMFF